MKAYLLLGVESSGNHLFCTIFSQLRIDGLPVVGTDMLGWTTGRPIDHEEERYERVWLGLEPLQVPPSSSFVTSRSFPCGCDWPNVKRFWDQAVSLNYDPLAILLVRDHNIVRRSAARRGSDLDVAHKWEMLFKAVEGLRHRFISYEGLVYLKKKYLMHWLANEVGNFDIDDHWFDLVVDQNAKNLVKDVPDAQRDQNNGSDKPSSH